MGDRGALFEMRKTSTWLMGSGGGREAFFPKSDYDRSSRLFFPFPFPLVAEELRRTANVFES